MLAATARQRVAFLPGLNKHTAPMRSCWEMSAQEVFHQHPVSAPPIFQHPRDLLRLARWSSMTENIRGVGDLQRLGNLFCDLWKSPYVARSLVTGRAQGQHLPLHAVPPTGRPLWQCFWGLPWAPASALAPRPSVVSSGCPTLISMHFIGT